MIPSTTCECSIMSPLARYLTMSARKSSIAPNSGTLTSAKYTTVGIRPEISTYSNRTASLGTRVARPKTSKKKNQTAKILNFSSCSLTETGSIVS